MDKPDYMSEQEFKDLEEMKCKTRDEKIKTFDYMSSILKYSQEDLNHSGYAKFTHAEAIKKILEDSNNRIDKFIKEYVKKYPD